MQKGQELLIAGDLKGAERFAAEIGDALAAFATEAQRVANPKKWSIGTLFGASKDPFRDERELWRSVAKKWQMDPVYLKAIGAN